MPDVDDPATATLTVSPFSGTTAATLAVSKPDGTTVDPAPEASTADSGATWTATVTYDEAGWWLLTWTVTGTGAGVEHQRVYVPPAPTAGGPQAYITLERIKSVLKITDTDRDEDLTLALRAASRSIDNYTGRRFYLDTTATARFFTRRHTVYSRSEGWRLMVDDIGATTSLAVAVGNEDGGYTAVTGFTNDPPNALVEHEPLTAFLKNTAWIVRNMDRAKVTARWGWPAVPDVVEQATLIQATRLFKRKDSPEGVVGSAEWGVVRVGAIDPDVRALIQHLVLPGLA